jgi:carbamoylphosphate synthase large subunit
MTRLTTRLTTQLTARLTGQLKTVGMLGLLTLTAPLDAVITAVALVVPGRRTAPRLPAPQRRTVLVSGGKMTKALELARAFHEAGHRVVLVETARYRLTGHRFSRAVDAFHVVPPPDAPDYADALLRVVKEEQVDVYVPVCSPLASRYDAEAKALLDGHCAVVHLDPEPLRTVDDKFAFFRAARELGLDVPDTHHVSDPQQALEVLATVPSDAPNPYILKSIAYDPVHRLDLTPLPRPSQAETEAYVHSLPISPDNPWILQEFITGEEFCTHGTVRDGRLTVYLCCASSASQLNYEMVDKPAIRAWVERFVAAGGYTGQLSFDFIEDAAGVVHAIECNPRTHSAITLLHHHPGLAAAYLDEPDEPGEPGDGAADPGRVEAPLGARPTYWLHHELWHAVRHPRQAPARLRTIAAGRDAVLCRADPLPFFMLHHVHLPSLLLQNLRAGRPWVKIDVNIGKLVEPGGD